MNAPLRVITHCRRSATGYSAGQLLKESVQKDIPHVLVRKRTSAPSVTNIEA